MPALLPCEPVSQDLRVHVLHGSSCLPAGLPSIVSLRPWSPQAPWDARGCPCHLTWGEHGDTPPPALGTRMDTGHPWVIESRGLVCRCEAGSAIHRGETETAHASPRLPSGFTRTPAGTSRTVFLCLPWGTALPHLSIPHTGLE